MADIDTALAASRDAVDQLIRGGEQSGAAWIAPRASGKWSPSQIVEHVARTLEESANMAAGRPSKVPRLPAVVRPIARLLFKRVLRKAAFPKGFKANKALNPASGPATPAEGRIRLETAHQEFNEACRRIAADGRPMTTGFGSVPALEYVRFQELHTRHHCKQMTTRQQAPSSMSQTSLVAIFVFVAGLGGGYFARSAAATLQRRTQAADVAAIEILNQEDIEATLARDQKRLIELWAENAVAFYPGSPPAVGKEAIGAHNQEFHAQYPGLKVLSYTSKIKNLQVEGGVACEWYEKDAEYRFSPESSPVSWHSKGLIVLKRQSDGSWKAVMIWPE